MKSSMIDKYIKLIEKDMSRFLDYSLSNPNPSEGYSGYIIDLIIDDIPDLYMTYIMNVSRKQDIKTISSNKKETFRDSITLMTSTYVENNLMSKTRSLELSYG